LRVEGVFARSIGRSASLISRSPTTTKSLSIDSNYAPAYLGRGMVYRQKGQLIQALQDFNQAIQIRQDCAQASFNRGLLYQSQHNISSRSTTSQPPLGRPSKRPSPTLHAVWSYSAINDFKAAAGDLDDAVQLEPQNANAWVSRGLAYERMGDKERPPALMRRRSTSGRTILRPRKASRASAVSSARATRRSTSFVLRSLFTDPDDETRVSLGPDGVFRDYCRSGWVRSEMHRYNGSLSAAFNPPVFSPRSHCQSLDRRRGGSLEFDKTRLEDPGLSAIGRYQSVSLNHRR
jgi:hypothetical protein